MSSRKLGGGRILGSGKGLAAPLPHPPPSPASSIPTTSGASVSAAAHASRTKALPPPPSDTPVGSPGNLDLTSTILEDDAASSNGGRPGPAQGLNLSSSTTLECPICQEEMLTLLQLNRHIDDIHQELPELEQDEVRSWFDKQVLKAKRFQPLSLFAATQKLRGLEVFESNETNPALSSSSSSNVPDPSSSFHTRTPSSSISRVATETTPTPVDVDEIITRKHWQRSTLDDTCTDPTCDRRLGPLTGAVNCRKCGRLFCEEHTMYQMKLSRAANHEPVRGYWARVCETCYKSRDGYNDHCGVLTDHTAAFTAIRGKKVERQNLDIARLEKRLTKLTRLLANPPPDDAIANNNGNDRGAIAALGASTFANTAQAKKKALEQTVVAWEDDKAVSRCPFCQQEFGSWSFRRHHCRMCGRVVCSDAQTLCSTEIPLTVMSASRHSREGSGTGLAPTRGNSEKPGDGGRIELNVRMCQDCKTTIFSKRDFQESVAHKPPDQRAYETLRQFERGISLLMPSFQRALMALQPRGDDTPPPSHAQIQEAAKIRKRLTDSFTKYDVAARRVRDLKTDRPTQERLQKAIYTAASTFLHTNMLPLKSLPQMLKSQSSSRRSGALSRKLVPSALRHEESSSVADTASVAGSEGSTVVSAIEQEERELREKMMILEEQKFMVGEMVGKARGQRRFEEVSVLTRNMEELEGEIGRLKGEVEGVEGRWEIAYETTRAEGMGGGANGVGPGLEGR